MKCSSGLPAPCMTQQGCKDDLTANFKRLFICCQLILQILYALQASTSQVKGWQQICGHSKHTSAFGAEMCGVGPEIGDGFRGSRMRLELFLFLK
jgi:hypothetical protein